MKYNTIEDNKLKKIQFADGFNHIITKKTLFDKNNVKNNQYHSSDWIDVLLWTLVIDFVSVILIVLSFLLLNSITAFATIIFVTIILFALFITILWRLVLKDLDLDSY